MSDKQFFTIRIFLVLAVGLGNLALLIWDYFHGGVPSHYILQREDLPNFSNWWGSILLPLLTWFLTLRIQKRIYSNYSPPKILYAGIAGLAFGMILSVLFTLGNPDLPFFWVMGLFILSIFFPIYLSECFLGCVIGMVYTFGGVLPLIIVSVFSIIGALIYLGIRPIFQFAAKKFMVLLDANR